MTNFILPRKSKSGIGSINPVPFEEEQQADEEEETNQS